jgi:hypothetical protein
MNPEESNKKSFVKLAILIGFMAFLYINLLAGGVLTVGLGAIIVRMFTHQ